MNKAMCMTGVCALSILHALCAQTLPADLDRQARVSIDKGLAWLVDRQRPDGAWQNDNNRWWEHDPVLATSYTLLALGMAVGLTR